MSCCPPKPASSALGSSAQEPTGVESDIRPTESVECYMARGGNTTGKQDDATENVDNKIENSSIPISRSKTAASINVQFKLTTPNTIAPTNRVASSWAMVNNGGEPLSSLGISMSSSGLLNGTLAPAALNKTFKVTVTASDTTGVIDSRGFVFAPSIGGDDSQIRLTSPLPGGIINSKFGPRLHPIQNVMKPHTGVDMKMQDRSVKDIVASADGEVILAGGDPSRGYGIRVHVKHSTSTGQHLCNTTYNHLAKVYVSVGQKVIAGQKLGLIGTTGSSTGIHLHFEVRLPGGKFIDPEPLINGQVTSASKTLPNGDADETSLTTSNNTASLAPAEVQARSDSCAPFGPGYPAADPPETTDPVPPVAVPSSDPFEIAWNYTMTFEVGPHWRSTAAFSPGDPELDAGIISTPLARKKTGFSQKATDTGGTTKFGISQKWNTHVVVVDINYATAKRTGFNNYWKVGRCPTFSPLVAIMMFDIIFLYGPPQAGTIYRRSGITSVPGDSLSTQQQHIVLLSQSRITFSQSINQPANQRGWARRANECLAFVQSLPPL